MCQGGRVFNYFKELIGVKRRDSGFVWNQAMGTPGAVNQKRAGGLAFRVNAEEEGGLPPQMRGASDESRVKAGKKGD